MLLISLISLLWLSLFHSVNAWIPPACQFARHFSVEQLIGNHSNFLSAEYVNNIKSNNQSNQHLGHLQRDTQSNNRYTDEFLMSVAYWEGQFMQPSVCKPIPPNILDPLADKTLRAFIHPLNQLPHHTHPFLHLESNQSEKKSTAHPVDQGLGGLDSSTKQSVGQWINQHPCLFDQTSFVGYDPRFGLTLDGSRLSITAGTILEDGQHLFTAASKESLHLSMLARALDGDQYAQRFIAPWYNQSTNRAHEPASQHPDDECIEQSINPAVKEAILQLSIKVNTYDEFNLRYPGYGGYLPWVSVNQSGVYPIHQVSLQTVQHTVPSLDNGELIWSIVSVIQALKTHHCHVTHLPMLLSNGLISRMNEQSAHLSINQLVNPSTKLVARYEALIDRLTASLMTVFYTGGGRFRTVTGVRNIHGPVTPSNYYDGSKRSIDQTINQSNNHLNSQPDSLNDPYEGELFTNFAYLFANWSTTNDSRSSVWEFKRKMLQPATLTINRETEQENAQIHDINQPKNQNINRTNTFVRYTVQKGWWYSSHEQWKYLMLPYTDSPTNKRVFVNGEKARIAYSNNPSINQLQNVDHIAGLYASSSGLAHNDNEDTGYLSACGIDEIAYQPVTNVDVVTPYGSMTLMLANREVGFAWYLAHLQSTRAQTCYGASEALNRTGTMWSPLKTWDTSITVLLGMLGGVSDLTRQYLIDSDKYYDLIDVIEYEWSRKFPIIEGEHEPWQLPTQHIPWGLMSELPTCLPTSNVCQCVIQASKLI